MDYIKLYFYNMAVILLIFLVDICTVNADSHVLQYYFTALKKSGQNPQWYSIVGIMDNLQILRYNSDSHKAEALYDWMKDPREPQTWEKNITHLAQEYEQQHCNSLQRIEELFNQSVEFHTYQIKFECVYFEDHSIGGHIEFGYNRKELLFFDRQKLLYYPAMDKAPILTEEWNRNEQSIRADKKFSEEHCVHLIDRYKKHVREELKTDVRPEVKVWGHRHSDGMGRLHCLVYGFHPRAVDVKWMRNGVDRIPSDEMTPILPHPDGTYRIRVSVEVVVSNNNFSCHVEHRSLEKTLSVDLEGFIDQSTSSKRRQKTALPLIASLLFITSLVLCVFKLRKHISTASR
ncbi:major histocompatibility complex class I-related gene protein-like [Pyxicephalus adspersus]|uniref:major histocompatibility complex class I-related gene protein-like n=1 Tax=Pyxicephalus adspersus TaxID=30357 RepID=UPI003B5B5937